MKRFLLLIFIIITILSYNLFLYIEEDTNNFFDSYLIIRKSYIKASKSKNLAEIIKEFSNINIKNTIDNLF